MGKKIDPDVKALAKACAWIEKHERPEMVRATAEFIYDRYVRRPSKGTRWA